MILKIVCYIIGLMVVAFMLAACKGDVSGNAGKGSHVTSEPDEEPAQTPPSGLQTPENVNSVTAVWIVRHAERQDIIDPNWGKTAKYIDDPELSANGVLQAKACAQKLKNGDIPHIFSSPFLRTIQTASEIANVLGLRIKVEEGLSEWLRYDWFNPSPVLMPLEEKTKLYPIDSSYTSLGSAVFPETEEDVKARVGKTLDSILQQYTGEILLVGHGASTEAAAEALVAEGKVHTGLCCIIKIVRSGDDWVVERDGSESESESTRTIRS